MPTAQNKYTQSSQHDCNQIENIVSLKKDVESHDKRITNVESKQTELEQYILEARELLTEQRKTNEFLEKTIAQNAKFLERSDEKYEKEINEIKQKLQDQEIKIISDNQKQDEQFSKDKTALILKVLGWTIAAIGTLAGIIWKFVIK